MQDATVALPNSAAQRGRLRRIGESGFTGPLRHCVTTAVELLGPVDDAYEDDLRARLHRLVTRHVALGSVFGAGTHLVTGGDPSLRHHVQPGPDPESRWRAARQIADFEAQRPFAVGEHPLIRALLLTADEQRHLLVLTVDQLVADAWSANLLLDDLLTGTDGPPDAYPTVWRAREDWLAGATGTSALARRRQHVADAALRWPLPVGADPDASAPLVDRFAALDDTVAEALRGQVRAARGTLLAAGAMALASLATDRDQPLALRTTLAGREGAAEQGVVGWFANEGVLRLPPRTGTVTAYATALRGEIFGALEDQRIPFECVADALPAGTPDGPSVALVLLPGALTGGLDGEQRLGDVVARRAGVSICPTGADVDVFLLENPPPMSTTPRAVLTAGVLADPARVGLESLEHLLRRFVDALTVLASVPWPDTAVDELSNGTRGHVRGRA